jgi:uncharacterized membrane protein (DUF373 family)
MLQSDGPEPTRMAPPLALPRPWHVGRMSALIERGVAMLVIFMLVIGVVLVVWNTALGVWHGLTTETIDYGLTVLLSQALLALMIAEIISTVGAFLERGEFDPVPLLIIGIIASIRRLLVISAEAANFVGSGTEVPMSMLVELGILTVAIGTFAWSIRQLKQVGSKDVLVRGGID